MSTYILVHGSWVGGWCWDRLRPLLERDGNRVLTPTMSPASADSTRETEVDLTTHIDHIASLLREEDLVDVILVGHSYGGMVASGVMASPEAHRIAQVIYVDAFVPKSGQSAFDILPWLADAMNPIVEMPWAAAPMDFSSLGVTAAEDLAWIADNVTNLPLRTHSQPLPSGSESRLSEIPVTYVLCTGQPLFNDEAARAVQRGFTVLELDSGHMPMITCPDKLATTLSGITAGIASIR